MVAIRKLSFLCKILKIIQDIPRVTCSKCIFCCFQAINTLFSGLVGNKLTHGSYAPWNIWKVLELYLKFSRTGKSCKKTTDPGKSWKSAKLKLVFRIYIIRNVVDCKEN